MTKIIELQSPECEKLAERIYTLAMRFFLSHPEFKMRRGYLYQTVKNEDVVDHCCCGAGAAWLQADEDKEESERIGSKLILGSSGLSSCYRADIFDEGSWARLDDHFYNAFDARILEVTENFACGSRTDRFTDSPMKRAAIRLVDDLVALGVQISHSY